MPQVREHTAIRRLQIVEAARKIIVERGSENITVKALADAVGISEGAIYRHFNQKQDVLLFLIDDVGVSLLSDLKYISGAGTLALKKVEMVLKRHITSIEQRRGVSFQIIAEIVSMGDKKLNGRVSEVIQSYVNKIEALLREGIASGELRPELDARASAVLIFSTIHGLVNLWTLGGYNFKLRKAFDSSWAIIWPAMARSDPVPVCRESNPEKTK
jgi:AcrR family transcriptional regulator